MLKFIRQYADKIGGIEIYPIISLVIFVLFFLAVLVYVRKMKQSSVDAMSQLPLDLQEETQSKTA
jgi:cytochrome c oxidase cbb3-type subunit IV